MKWKPINLRYEREISGLSRQEVANSLLRVLFVRVDPKTIGNWEERNKVPEQYYDAVRKVFEEEAKTLEWSVDSEPRTNSEIIETIISYLNNKDYSNAVIWSNFLEEHPVTQKQIDHSLAEKALHKVLRAKSLFLLDQDKRYQYYDGKTEAERLYGEVEGDSEKNIQNDNDPHHHIWIRAYADAHCAMVIKRIRKRELTLANAINEFRKIILLLEKSNSDHYVYIIGKMYWNILNASMISSPRDTSSATDAVNSLVKIHGSTKVKNWIMYDGEVRDVLKHSGINKILGC